MPRGRERENEPKWLFPFPKPFSFSQILMHWFELLLNSNLNMHACMKGVPPYVQQPSNHSHNVTPKALFLSEPIYTKLILMLIVLFIDLCYISVDSFFFCFLSVELWALHFCYRIRAASRAYTPANRSKRCISNPRARYFSRTFPQSVRSLSRSHRPFSPRRHFSAAPRMVVVLGRGALAGRSPVP